MCWMQRMCNGDFKWCFICGRIFWHELHGMPELVVHKFSCWITFLHHSASKSKRSNNNNNKKKVIMDKSWWTLMIVMTSWILRGIKAHKIVIRNLYSIKVIPLSCDFLISFTTRLFLYALLLTKKHYWVTCRTFQPKSPSTIIRTVCHQQKNWSVIKKIIDPSPTKESNCHQQKHWFAIKNKNLSVINNKNYIGLPSTIKIDLNKRISLPSTKGVIWTKESVCHQKQELIWTK